MIEAGWQSLVKLFKGGGGGGGKARNRLYLPHVWPLKNCNHIPIRLIKLCPMNHVSGAKL